MAIASALSQPLLMAVDGLSALALIARDIFSSTQKPDSRVIGTSPAFTMSGDGVASINVRGPIVKGGGTLIQLLGGVSHERIVEGLNGALAANPKEIVFNVDSPGGSFAGTPELASAIDSVRAMGIPMSANVDGMAASAGYWIAASTGRIVAEPTSKIGSIGVILEVRTIQNLLESAGINIQLFVSGPLKAAGHPAKTPTADHSAYFQQGVNDAAAMFKSAVNRFRPGIAESSMNGGMFLAADAKARGLIDEVSAGFAIQGSSGAKISPASLRSSNPTRAFWDAVNTRMTSAKESKAVALVHVVKTSPALHQEFLDHQLAASNS